MDKKRKRNRFCLVARLAFLKVFRCSGEGDRLGMGAMFGFETRRGESKWHFWRIVDDQFLVCKKGEVAFFVIICNYSGSRSERV